MSDAVERLPPAERALWLCDDIAQRLQQCTDAKRPGPIALRAKQLAEALTELGLANAVPLRVATTETIGQRISWADPDGTRHGFMEFDVRLYHGRGGANVQQARMQLIAIVGAWKRYIELLRSPEARFANSDTATQESPMLTLLEQRAFQHWQKNKNDKTHMQWAQAFCDTVTDKEWEAFKAGRTINSSRVLYFQAQSKWWVRGKRVPRSQN